MEKIIYANGTADVLVPAGQKIAIATYGNEYATLSFKRGNNLEFIQRLDNSQVTLGPWSDARTVSIEAAQDQVSYDVGTAPNIDSNVRISSNPLTGGNGLVLGDDYFPLDLPGGANTIILAGDSLSANNAAGTTPTFAALQSSGAFSIANALGGNRFNVVGRVAVGGKTAAQVLAEQVPGIVAARPKYSYFSAGVNDLYFENVPGNVAANRIISIVQTLIAGGVTPMWSTVWARQLTAGITDDHIWCNDLLRQFAASNPCGIFFDGFRISQNHGSSTFGIRSGWTYDSAPALHVNNLGAYWLGKAMWKAYDPIVPKLHTLASGVEDQTTSVNNKSNILVNPFFAGTAGTVSANCTGTMPDSWVIDWATRTGTGSAAASIVDVLDTDTGLPVAKGIQVVLSGTPAAGDVLRISQSTGFNTQLSAGDSYSSQCVLSLVNPTFTQQVSFRTQTQTLESTWWGNNAPAASGAGTYESYPESATFTCETNPMVVSGSGVANQARFDVRITYNGAATGTLVFSQPRVRKL